MTIAFKKTDPDSIVSDIVNNDYRTAEVFRKHGIEYCCGGKWPLKMVCAAGNLDVAAILEELDDAMRTIKIPNTVKFEEWDLNFLIDYTEFAIAIPFAFICRINSFFISCNCKIIKVSRIKPPRPGLKAINKCE